MYDNIPPIFPFVATAAAAASAETQAQAEVETSSVFHARGQAGWRAGGQVGWVTSNLYQPPL